MERSLRSTLPPIFAALLLAACGGGGGDENNSNVVSSASISTLEPSAPAATGSTASDGFNWFNFRRAQIGLPAVTHNSTVSIAAQGHSDYQKIWGIDHYQVEGRTGFTGICVYDNPNDPNDPQCPQAKVSRLEAANYHFPPNNFAFGEVISATSNPSGHDAAEGLISAIYHRFVIFEPMFKEAGVGAAASADGITYFTTNFVANGLNTAYSLCAQKNPPLVTYPFDGQQRVQRSFSSDSEVPDPVPGQDMVGYPISVHADITASISTQSFTVRPRGGAPLPVRTLTDTLDPAHTPSAAAAVVPLSALAANTTYDVQFIGTVHCPLLNKSVNLTWSFTTR